MWVFSSSSLGQETDCQFVMVFLRPSKRMAVPPIPTRSLPARYSRNSLTMGRCVETGRV